MCRWNSCQSTYLCSFWKVYLKFFFDSQNMSLRLVPASENSAWKTMFVASLLTRLGVIARIGLNTEHPKCRAEKFWSWEMYEKVIFWPQACDRRWRWLFGVLGHEGSWDWGHNTLKKKKYCHQNNCSVQVGNSSKLTNSSLLSEKKLSNPPTPLSYMWENIWQACLDPNSGPDRLSYRAHNTYVEVDFIWD